jgi:hypothetical protein
MASEKDEALELIAKGYYGNELEIEELIPMLDAAIRAIKECTHDEEN